MPAWCSGAWTSGRPPAPGSHGRREGRHRRPGRGARQSVMAQNGTGSSPISRLSSPRRVTSHVAGGVDSVGSAGVPNRATAARSAPLSPIWFRQAGARPRVEMHFRPIGWRTSPTLFLRSQPADAVVWSRRRVRHRAITWSVATGAQSRRCVARCVRCQAAPRGVAHRRTLLARIG
jgi:hypothetical protein